jgi:general stress protein 26
VRASTGVLAVTLLLGARDPLLGQQPPGNGAGRAQILAAARAIMAEARYCTLVTLDSTGQPQARVVDPFVPDSDLTIWIATKPITRKAHEIRRDPRVTLLYFNAPTQEYVTVIGSALLDTDSVAQARHWKPEWAANYPHGNRGSDYLLLRVTPARLEVVSFTRGMRNDPHTWRPVVLELRPTGTVLPN